MRKAGWTLVLAAAAVGGALAAVEIALRAIGLGDPILYDNRLAYGYRPLPNQTRVRRGGAHIHVNALGARGPDVAPARAPDTTRLLFLGDSVTWGGTYVDDGELFAAVAAEVVARGGARVEWLDAGVNAWGPENVLGLVHESRGFDSSAWIVTALEDDLRREKTHAGEVPYFGRAPAFAWEELLAFGAYRVLTAYKVAKPAADLMALAARNLQTYGAIVEAGRAAGATVLLVWHPTIEAVEGADEPHRDRLLAVGAERGARTLDLTPTYRAAGGDVYVDGVHLSARGHRVAGEAIGAALIAPTRDVVSGR